MYSFFSFLKNKKGTTIVYLSIILSVISALTALTVDIGVLVLEKSRLSASVDAAALAGAQQLITDSNYVENTVHDYLNKNSGSLADLNINVISENRTVKVAVDKAVNMFFAKVFGVNAQQISATAHATIQNIKSLKGVRPFGIVNQNFIYGQKYTLKEGAGDGTSGNYSAMALGGTGTSVYKSNLLNGYTSRVSTGNIIQTETGVMANATVTGINQLIDECNHTPECTYEYYNVNCSRIIFVPIVNPLELNGRSYVEVLGFGTFFLEGVEKNGGHAEITGRFITYNTQGEMSDEINDYGTYGIKLTK